MSKSKMLIGIITINDYANYGNRLQNYALNQLLGGNEKCTTVYMDTKRSNFFDYYFRPPIRFFKKVSFMFFALFSESKRLEVYRKKKGVFFTKKYSPDDLFSLTAYKGLKSAADESLRCIVIGSDQVWNDRWIDKKELACRLGSFAFSKQPVISYAASFGLSEVDQTSIPIFQKYLPRLKAISVREDRGMALVGEMTGLNAAVVLDPTLMLTSNKWIEIFEGFVPDDDEYVLTYFLGRPSDEQERDIQAYAKAHGCRVRRILDLRDKETYVAGPQDFVELFSKAQYVFTDSYHACCFSILFHTQFTVFNRAGMTGKSSMNSRMETLFRLFDLDSVMMDSGLAPEIDYAKVDRLLEQHRRESRDWLDKAMKE